MNFIDNILDRITMYRVALYYLIFLWLAALIFSGLGLLPFSAFALLYSTAIIFIASYVSNFFSAKFFNLPANPESVYISAFILILIITPPKPESALAILPLLIGASVFAEVSKYALNIQNKHIFNPAALGAAAAAFAINQSASWWVGTSIMFWPVLIGGILTVRKVRRFSMVFGFLLAAVLAALAASSAQPLNLIRTMLFSSPLLFFAAIMLTEPLTVPPGSDKQIAYGILTGFLFSPFTRLGPLYFSPEQALLLGNIFSYIISPKQRLKLILSSKKLAAKGVGEFGFILNKPLKFQPGQYLEFTLGHKNADSRGIRRYLTIASSPLEKELLLGVKFYENPSSLKRELLNLLPGREIYAGQLAGDFVLPKNPSKKLAFIAGGIGITPFRSMIRHLLDTGEARDIILIYSNRKAEEIAYKNIFDSAENLNVKTIYTLTDKKTDPAWQGRLGYVNGKFILENVPDFKDRVFYISGSHQMTESVKQALKSLGVSRFKIKTDFFPGLA